jgi:hypothetical protein
MAVSLGDPRRDGFFLRFASPLFPGIRWQMSHHADYPACSPASAKPPRECTGAESQV